MGAVRNPDGSRQILPSEIESLAQVHNLTIPEAEVLSYRVSGEGQPLNAAVAAIKAARVEYRQSYEAVPATAENHPLVAQDAKKDKATKAKA